MGENNNYNEIEYPKMWDDYTRWNMHLTEAPEGEKRRVGRRNI